MKQKNIMTTMLLFLSLIIFSGCSAMGHFFSVGEEKSFCKENGCDYTNVGVCAGPIDILENKNDLSVLKNQKGGK